MPNFRDRTGQRFGRLTALFEAPRKNGTGRVRWLCRCDCGNEKTVSSSDLVGGRTQSCGCLQSEMAGSANAARAKHGHARAKKGGGRATTPEYRSWKSMLERCRNANAQNYHLYGGRGIKVCERWRCDGGFLNFLSDMGERPEGASLDRINVNGDYSPDNCRWSDAKAQSNNRRNTPALQDARAANLQMGRRYWPRKTR